MPQAHLQAAGVCADIRAAEQPAGFSPSGSCIQQGLQLQQDGPGLQSDAHLSRRQGSTPSLELCQSLPNLQSFACLSRQQGQTSSHVQIGQGAWAAHIPPGSTKNSGEHRLMHPRLDRQMFVCVSSHTPYILTSLLSDQLVEESVPQPWIWT